MFKRPTQKQQLAQRIIVSVLAVFAILVGVTATVLFIMGYRIDSGTGRLEQGALMQFDSVPSGAGVWIDDMYTGSSTSSKRTVLAGEHVFKFARDGYQDWTRKLDVKAGTMTWLDYARLVPKERPVSDVASFSTLVAAKASADRKTYILQEDAELPVFKIADLRSEKVEVSALTLPTELYSESQNPEVKHAFNIISWDDNGRYVIATHSFGEGFEWLVIDTRDVSRSENVSRVLQVSLRDMQFVGSDGRTFYGLGADGIIRKLDLGSQTISRALVTNVDKFSIDPDTKIVSYSGLDPQNIERKVVGVYRDGDASGYILRGTTADIQLGIATGMYHGSNYVAISEGGSISILRGSYPASSAEKSSLSAYTSFTLDSPVRWLSFSREGDFLIARGDGSFIGHEIEHARSTVATVSDKATLKWLDAAYVWDITDGKLTMRDFDGSNVNEIMNAESGFDATLSQNGRFFYSIGLRENSFVLQRVTMRIN